MSCSSVTLTVDGQSLCALENDTKKGTELIPFTPFWNSWGESDGDRGTAESKGCSSMTLMVDGERLCTFSVKTTLTGTWVIPLLDLWEHLTYKRRGGEREQRHSETNRAKCELSRNRKVLTMEGDLEKWLERLSPRRHMNGLYCFPSGANANLYFPATSSDRPLMLFVWCYSWPRETNWSEGDGYQLLNGIETSKKA